jgi:hypothetical protein
MSQNTDNAKPICVVLDANIWIQERLLKSSLGAALLYGLRQIGGFIGLPEVTEKEVLRGIVETGQDAVKGINKGFGIIQTIAGEMPNHKLPTKTDFENYAIDRIRDLNPLLIRVDVSFEHCMSALNRVIQHTAPNSKKEQFRDTLLWETVLQLAPDYRLRLITNDLDFYQGNNYESGLAQELVLECEQIGQTLALYQNLQTYLKTLQESVPAPDYDKIASLISEAISSEVQEYTSEESIRLGGLVEHPIEAFLTERVNKLALSFRLIYEASNVQSFNDTIFPEAKMIVSGDCLYDLDEETISDLRFKRIDFTTPTSEIITGAGMGYTYGDASFGSRAVPYRLRKAL